MMGKKPIRFNPRKYRVTVTELSTVKPYSFSQSSWTIEFKDAMKVVAILNNFKAYTKKKGRGNSCNWIKKQAIKWTKGE